MTRKTLTHTIQFLAKIRERFEFNGLTEMQAEQAMLIVAEELASRGAHQGDSFDTLLKQFVRGVQTYAKAA